MDSEIPVEYDDLPINVQEALLIYGKLRDDWDTMNGVYLGKNFQGILDLFEILDIAKTEQRSVFDLICEIDKHRAKALKSKK